MTDALAAIRTILLNDSTVNTLVSGRVGYEVPEADNSVMPRAAIVVSPAGGPSTSDYLPVGKTRFSVVCFGATISESWAVYLAAYEVLKNLRTSMVGGVIVYSAEPTSKGSVARDPVKQWPVTYSTWLLLAAETA